jgi:hypothetical protein
MTKWSSQPAIKNSKPADICSVCSEISAVNRMEKTADYLVRLFAAAACLFIRQQNQDMRKFYSS